MFSPLIKDVEHTVSTFDPLQMLQNICGREVSLVEGGPGDATVCYIVQNSDGKRQACDTRCYVQRVLSFQINHCACHQL